MLEQRIEQHFIDSADLKYQAAQVLSKPIAAAVSAVLASVTSGGKVLACGNGGSAASGRLNAAVALKTAPLPGVRRLDRGGTGAERDSIGSVFFMPD